jgi:tRNA(Ile)-lysidine synthetase-like protein
LDPKPMILCRVQREKAAKAIIRAWRRLTTAESARKAGPGAPTVVALSGGADSSALALALAAGGLARRGGLCVHVMHDLRERAQVLADRDACRRLCDRLGVELVERGVGVRAWIAGRGGGLGGDATNLEAVARRLRYRAIAQVARERGIGFIATAHHTDDQLETMLMHLVRGSGPRGLAGIAPRRTLPVSLDAPASFGAANDRVRERIEVVRPLLFAGLGRGDARSLCTSAGWDWVEDATNADTSHLRAAIRHRVAPVLLELRPRAACAAARGADLLREADQIAVARAGWLADQGSVEDGKSAPDRCGGAYAWPRSMLRTEPRLVLGNVIRAAASQVGSDAGSHLDRLTLRTLAPVLRAIRDDSTEPRRFSIGSIDISISAREVRVERGDRPRIRR